MAMSKGRHDMSEGEVVSTDWGALISLREGTLRSDLPMLSSVGVHNLAEVTSYEIVRVAGMVSHYVRFYDGGSLRFAYSDRGQLVELAGERIRVHVDKEGHMLVAAYGDGKLPM
jgi:hypothetical protein